MDTSPLYRYIIYKETHCHLCNYDPQMIGMIIAFSHSVPYLWSFMNFSWGDANRHLLTLDRAPTTEQSTTLQISTLANQWVYLTYLQGIGEGFLTGTWGTPKQPHHKKVPLQHEWRFPYRGIGGTPFSQFLTLYLLQSLDQM